LLGVHPQEHVGPTHLDGFGLDDLAFVIPEFPDFSLKLKKGEMEKAGEQNGFHGRRGCSNN